MKNTIIETINNMIERNYTTYNNNNVTVKIDLNDNEKEIFITEISDMYDYYEIEWNTIIVSKYIDWYKCFKDVRASINRL